MERVLLHCCCAPCSLSCIDPLRAEGIEPVAFWYNPNIHPWKEYEARRNCLLEYAPTIGMETIVLENYGLRDFVRAVADDIEHRCRYCYESRMEQTARFAAEHGFKAFTSTLLASVYQDHDGIAEASARFAARYGVEFLYRDFRPNFREGNKKARELGFYMQKYCGCVFSEEDRYRKAIARDRAKYDALLTPGTYDAANLRSVLTYMRGQFGAAFSRDAGKMYAALTDLAPALKRDGNVIRQLIEKGLLAELEASAGTRDEARALAKARLFLTDDLYLRADKASEVMEALRAAYGLRGAKAPDADAPQAAKIPDAAETKPDILESGVSGNLRWTLDADGLLKITGLGDMPDYRFRAPWWRRRKEIRAAEIESGVTSIGNEAFHGCKSLQSVAIPDSVTRIGDWAFDGCASLEALDIPDSVAQIGDWAFSHCVSLTSVTLPEGVARIGHAAFSRCANLTSVKVPDSVAAIESLAFFNCDRLSSITIPAATQIKHGLQSAFDMTTAVIRRM